MEMRWRDVGGALEIIAVTCCMYAASACVDICMPQRVARFGHRPDTNNKIAKRQTSICYWRISQKLRAQFPRWFGIQRFDSTLEYLKHFQQQNCWTCGRETVKCKCAYVCVCQGNFSGVWKVRQALRIDRPPQKRYPYLCILKKTHVWGCFAQSCVHAKGELTFSSVSFPPFPCSFPFPFLSFLSVPVPFPVFFISLSVPCPFCFIFLPFLFLSPLLQTMDSYSATLRTIITLVRGI